MNKGIINQNLLEKNIQQINLYQEEETKILEKIYRTLKEGTKSYQSTNTALLLNEIHYIKKNIHLIEKKRVEYADVLNKAISNYSMLENKTIQTFNENNE